MRNLDFIFGELGKAGAAPEWSEDGNTIFATVGGTDYEITRSAAPGYFGVKAATPFEEPDFYAINGAEAVLALVKGVEA